MRKLVLGVAVLAAAGAQLGCAAEIQEPQGDEAVPIWSTALSDVSTFEIYEPQDGVLIVSGELPNSESLKLPTLSGRNRVVDIYRALVPGAEVPREIIAAQARQDARLAALPQAAVQTDPTALEVSDADDAIVLKHNADAWFEDWCSSSHITHSNCILEQESECLDHRSGGGTWYRYNNREYFSAVRAYDGAISYRMRHRTGGDWKTVGTWSVAEGYMRWAAVWRDDETLDVENYIAPTSSGYDRVWLTGTSRYDGGTTHVCF